MKKHAKALMIAAALVLATTPVAVYAHDGDEVVQETEKKGVALQNRAPGWFEDLEGHFAKHAVNSLGDLGLLEKKVKTNFNPNATMDRKEFLDLLHKSLGKEVKTSKTDSNIDRLEAAVLIRQSMPPVNTGINGGNPNFGYKDTLDLTEEQQDALRYLYMTGLMVGDGKGHFNPKASMTRGEAAVLLERVVGRSLQAGKGVAFEKTAGELPQTVQTLVNENKAMEGLFSVAEGNKRYLLISGGEVPTGGFTINVDNIKETDAGIFVQASIHAPEPGTMVSEALDYPHLVVEIKDTTKPVYLFAE